MVILRVEDIDSPRVKAWAREATADTGLRVVILAGAGKVFSAGADATWMARMIGYSREDNVADATRMATLQGQLLAAAVEMLEPAGVLVYASCSLQPEEGPGVIEQALTAGAPVARHPVEGRELDGLPVDLTGEGDVRTLPCQLAGGGLDGFFIARLRRLG